MRFWINANDSRLALVALIALFVNFPANSVAEGGNKDIQHDHHAANQVDIEPEANQQALGPKYTRTLDNYLAPEVDLIDSNGENVALRELLANDEPVLMQFIFTSCATICPLMSATFSHGQNALEAVHDRYRMFSISIDPEYDTPDRLAAYAKRNSAGGNWTFLTGSKGDIGKVMRAFNVLYQSDNKMYHQPYTFLRAHADAPWIRIDGFLSVRELVHEFRVALRSTDVA
jgi:protein SCO1/2